jgi:methylated-DNA-protein-cysteine methyltransferase related protein
MAPDEQNSGFPDWYEAVYAAVRAVPKGKVATYGQVAGVVSGVVVTARQVGTAMHFAPSDVPWQRVVGAGGRLPIGKRSPELQLLQRQLLAQEGVPFHGTDPDLVDMASAQWMSESP